MKNGVKTHESTIMRGQKTQKQKEVKFDMNS
jgi:hypothetical protein